jgi:hypothetical protein
MPSHKVREEIELERKRIYMLCQELTPDAKERKEDKMKIVILRLDRYSKVILTVIGVALTVIAIRPFLPEAIEAKSQVMDVNIAEVGGGYVSYGTLRVEVENGSLDVNVENSPLDVNIQNASDIGYYVDYYWSH